MVQLLEHNHWLLGELVMKDLKTLDELSEIEPPLVEAKRVLQCSKNTTRCTSIDGTMTKLSMSRVN